MLILANAVAEVVGPRSPVFQHIMIAAGTRKGEDHLRARASFDVLPGDTRGAVQGKAEVTAHAVHQQAVLRKVLRNLPQWRPDNVEWVWPRGGAAPVASNQK
jgi:hypothetical protein